MNDVQPPRLATWLLQRLALGSRGESLTGDLIEKYQTRRSSAWYWRQVLTAILIGAASDLFEHRWLAARALAIGWIFYVLFSFPVNWLSRVARIWITDWLGANGYYSFWSVWWSGHLPSTLFVWLACAASGWIVARLHKGPSAAVVCSYAVTVLVFEYGMVSWMFLRHPLPPMPQPEAALFIPAVLVIGRPLSILLGGLWGARPNDESLGRIPVT